MPLDLPRLRKDFSDSQIVDGLGQELGLDVGRMRQDKLTDQQILESLVPAYDGLSAEASAPKAVEPKAAVPAATVQPAKEAPDFKPVAQGLDRSWSDVGNDALVAGKQGVSSLVAGLSWAADKIPGVDTREFTKAQLENSEYLESEKSGKAKSANNAVANAEGFVDTTFALISNPSAILDQAAQSAPVLIPGMGIGGAAAKVAAGRAAQKALAAGATREAAAAAAKAAAAAGAAAGGRAGESLASAGTGGAQAEDGVRSTPIESLRENSERFRELAGKVGDDAAREQLANEVGLTSALLQGGATLAGGALAAKINKVAKFGDSYAVALAEKAAGRKAASNVAGEIVEEGIQSPLEQVGQNVAQQKADNRVGATDDVGESVALGVAGAIGQSGAAQGIGLARNSLTNDTQQGSAPPAAPAAAPAAPAPAASAAPNNSAASGIGIAQADATRQAAFDQAMSGAVPTEAALQAKADELTAKAESAAVLAEEARAMGNDALAAQLESEAQAHDQALGQTEATIQREHRGIAGIVNRNIVIPEQEAAATVIAEQAAAQEALAPAAETYQDGNAGLIPDSGNMVPAESAISPDAAIQGAPTIEGGLTPPALAAEKPAAFDPARPIADIKTANRQHLLKRAGYLRGAIQATRDEDLKVSLKAELKAVNAEANGRPATSVPGAVAQAGDSPAAAAIPQAAPPAPAVSGRPEVSGAISELKVGDEVQGMTVKKVGTKAIILTDADGKEARFDVGTPRYDQLAAQIAADSAPVADNSPVIPVDKRDGDGLPPETMQQKAVRIAVMRAEGQLSISDRDAKEAKKSALASARQSGMTSDEISDIEAVAENTAESMAELWAIGATLLNEAVAGRAGAEHRTSADRRHEAAPVASEQRHGARRLSREALFTDPADMTPEQRNEAMRALQQHVNEGPLTGLPTKAVWEALKDAGALGKFLASLDADALKWFNDNIGHVPGGDKLLGEIGKALKTAGVNAFHISGDEFYATADSREALESGLKAAQSLLNQVKIAGNGWSVTGVGFSYGISENMDEAEHGLHADKAAREASGLRSGRGETPPGATKTGEKNDTAKQDGREGAAAGSRQENAGTLQAGGENERSREGRVAANPAEDGQGSRAGSTESAEVDPEQEAANRKEEQRQVRAERMRALNAERAKLKPTDELLTAIAKLGALDRDAAKAQGIDPADFTQKRAGIMLVFKKGGLSFDAMAEALDAEGYPVRDEQGRYSANTLLGLVDDSLRGNAVYAPAGHEAAAQAADIQRALEENDTAALPPSEAGAEFTQAESVVALSFRDVIRAGLDAEIVARLVAPEASFAEINALFQGLINGDTEYVRQYEDAKRAGAQDAADLAGRAGDNQEAHRADEDNFPGFGQGQDASELTEQEVERHLSGETLEQIRANREDFTLSTQSESDLAAKEAREQDEKAAAESEQARQIDATSGAFTLSTGTGSAGAQVRPAVRGAGRDMFASPAPTRGQAAGERIEDFGEKIGGAKKDLWMSFSKALEDELPADTAKITLAKYFPEPDYQKLIDAGVPQETLAAIKAMRDQIPSKPRKSYKLASWVQNLTAMRDLSHKLLDEKITFAEMRSKMLGSGRALADFVEQIDIYAGVGYPAFMKAADVSLNWGTHFTYADNANGVEQRTEHKNKYGPTYKNRRISEDFFEGKPAALAHIKAFLDGLSDAPKQERETKIDLYRVTDSGQYVLGRHLGGNKYIDLKSFGTLKEARAYHDANKAELVAQLEKFREDQANVPTRRSTNDPRRGEDYRQGEDISPAEFGEAFGFRGVEFGNWVEQGRRQQDLNNAYDALRDMAKVIGIPAKAVSLNGTLGMAFGARGRKGAVAHYELDKVVINLTKMEGAGALGHEWWHAMDNYFSRMRSLSDELLTQRPHELKEQGVRPEVIAAFGRLMKAIKASPMAKRSAAMDQHRPKDYWSTPEELSARAFEAHLITKTKERGESSDYLANLIDSDTAKIIFTGGTKEWPYPFDNEMESITAAFDELFQTIKVREENGNVLLYSRGAGTWYFSPLTRAVEGFKQETASAGQWRAMIENTSGLKADELAATGVIDWLQLQTGKVTKAQILDYLDANGVQVQEVVKGEGGGTPETKFGSYVVPGGENYRELLLTLPEKKATAADVGEPVRTSAGWEVPVRGDSVSVAGHYSKKAAAEQALLKYQGTDKRYKSSHWDEANILAHVRFDGRTDADGKRVLFIQEIQSDWGQEGKKKGFNGQLSEGRVVSSSVPQAPFVTKTDAWVSLAIKRMIRYAAENGFDRVAFINGQQSADLYDLSKQVKHVSISKPDEDGSRAVAIRYPDGGTTPLLINNKGHITKGLGRFVGKSLDEAIGKEAADRLMRIEGDGKLEGDGLRVGGEGMKTFYDKIVPKVAGDVIKKLGGGKLIPVRLSQSKPVRKYSGPSLSADAVIGVARDDNLRAAVQSQLREVVAKMRAGSSLAEAMEFHGSDASANAIGGAMTDTEELVVLEQTGFDITPSMRDAAMSGLPLFSKNKTESGQAKAAIEKLIAPVIEKWKNGPRVVVVQSVSELPGGAAPHDVEGAYSGSGTVYLVADNLPTEQRVMEVLAHEAIGHAAMEAMLGPELMAELVREIGAWERHGVKFFTELGKEVDRKQPGLSKERRAKEIVALMAEKGAHKKGNLWQRVVGAVRAFLRGMGINNKWLSNKTPADLFRMLADAERYLVSGKGARTSQAEVGSNGNQDGIAAYSRDETVGDSYLIPPARDHVIDVFDSFDRIKQIQDAVVAQGGTVSELSDIYGQEEAYHSRAASAIDRFRRHRMGGLFKRIARAGVRLEDVGLYLYAQHAPERNAQIAKLHQKGGQLNLDGTSDEIMQDGGSGMSNAEAAELLAAFEKQGISRKLDTFARELREITADSRKILRNSGLETAEAIDAWEAAYQFYVPLSGKDEANNASSVIVGRGFDVRGGQKRAMGRKDKAKHIIEQIIIQHEQAVIRAEKNAVGKRVLQFVRSNPDKKLWEVNPTQMRGYIVKVGNQQQVEFREQPRRTDRNVVSVRIDGKDTFILLADQGMADAIHNVGIEDVNFLLRALGAVSRFTSKMFTAFSPAFIAVNALRDFMTAMIHGYQVGGVDYSLGIAKNLPRAFAELVRDARNGTSDAVKLYEQAGGRTGMVYMIKDFEEKHNEVMSQMAALQGVSLKEIMEAFEAGYKEGFKAVGRKARYNKFTGVFDAFVEAVETVNGVVENTTRLAAFHAALEQGKSSREAGSIAKNLTVNFNRKGRLAPVLGTLYIFFNASVQGTVRMGQALRNPKLMAVAGGMTVFSAILAAMQMGDDDDRDGDGRADFEQIPAWQRSRNLIFMHDDGSYTKIPLPLGWNIFHTIGTEAAIMAMSKSKEAYGEGVLNMLGQTVDMFNPIGNLIPSIFAPIVNIARNETHFGGPIYPDYKDKLPDSQQFYDGMEGSVYERATRAANEATGGNEFRPGWVDVNPEKLEHLVEFFGGGALRFVTDSVDAATAMADGGPAQPMDKLPIVRAFHGQLRDEYQTSRYYENKDKVEAAETELKGLMDSQRFEEAAKVMNDKPWAGGLSAMADATQTQIKQIKTMEQMVRSDDSLSAGERRKQLQDLRVLRGQLVKPFNAAYEGAMSKGQ